MNPFLHDPVATVHAPPVRLTARRPSLARGAPRCRKPPRQARWPRVLGLIALATGLSMAASPAGALDVNTATIEQLRGVRGLGPKTAETIVKERERGGRYESMEDLSDRVRGIGMRKAQALEAAGLRVEGVRGAEGARSAAGASPASRGSAAGGQAKGGAQKAAGGRQDRQAPRGQR